MRFLISEVPLWSLNDFEWRRGQGSDLRGVPEHLPQLRRRPGQVSRPTFYSLAQAEMFNCVLESGHMVILRGGAVSYERGIPVAGQGLHQGWLRSNPDQINSNVKVVSDDLVLLP